MRHVTIATVFVTGLLLAACDEKKDCTPELLDQKSTDLMVAAHALSATSPDRMAEIGPQVADLVAQSQTAEGDLQPICDAIDALMDEIAK